MIKIPVGSIAVYDFSMQTPNQIQIFSQYR